MAKTAGQRHTMHMHKTLKPIQLRSSQNAPVKQPPIFIIV